MAVSTKDAEEEASVKELLDDLGADAGEETLEFSLALVDKDGDLVAQSSAGDLLEENEYVSAAARTRCDAQSPAFRPLRLGPCV